MAENHGDHAPHDHATDMPGHDHDHDTHADKHDHNHNHDGHGHHHGHSHAPASYGAAFLIGLSLNVAYIGIETIWGLLAHSLSLLSDAGHNLSDVLGLGAAWLAQSLAKRAPSSRFTYGLKRSTILSALSNAVLLLLVTGGIIWEAITRLAHPGDVAGRVVMLVALGGIVVNGGTALLFMRGGKDDLNLRGAFMHMAADALMSLAVVVTGIVIMMTGWVILDPIVSLLVCISIIVGTWSLLRASLDMALDGVPGQIRLDEVEASLRNLPGVEGLHHLHVWSLSTTDTALTVHLVSAEPATGQATILRNATTMLAQKFKIGHATFQIEAPGTPFPCGPAESDADSPNPAFCGRTI